MGNNRRWTQYPQTYRAREIKTLTPWIQTGSSGAVVGLPGSGKSNFLSFLCHRPDALPPQLANVHLIPIDLNILPDRTLATFYRVILRAFYEIRQQFNADLQTAVNQLYLAYQETRDAFLPQSALRELLLQMQQQEHRIVFVIDQFDDFCERATPAMTNTLRGLRDSFKDTLCYIIGLRQDVAYLPDTTVLGELYELLDTHVCWVKSMSDDDARYLIAQETHLASSPPTMETIKTLIILTGGYPSLLKAACHWWQQFGSQTPRANWLNGLSEDRSIQHRLHEIWTGLDQEERLVAARIQTWHLSTNVAQQETLTPDQRNTLIRLAMKGICQETEGDWRLFSPLFAAFVIPANAQGRGKLWLDPHTEDIYQGTTPLQGLTQLEHALLYFLLQHPRIRHTKTDLIINVWPDEQRRLGVTDDSLYQLVAALRKKVEPMPSRPCYLLNWRGKPEGGYQVFPEGHPG